MQLFCSNALQAKLGCKCEKHPAPTDPLDSWYAHLITVCRRNIVVVVLLRFRFVILIPGLKDKDKQWANLEALIRQRIRETLASYDIPQELVDKYLPANAPFEKCSAADPGDRAKLSSVVKQVREVLSVRPDVQSMQNGINGYHSLAGGDKVDYGIPCRELRRALMQRYHMPNPAMELEFSLDLERYVARCTLIVPANITFRSLHNCLQKAYRWQDYHLHEFTLPPTAHRELQTSVILEDEDTVAAHTDTWQGDAPEEKLCFDHNTRLSDLLQEKDTFLYTYDFGDSWTVSCKVARCIPDCQGELPVCTLLEGKALPEDVGGVGGYLDFLDIIEDPSNPEYEESKIWAGPLWFRDWTAEDLNRQFQYRDYSLQ